MALEFTELLRSFVPLGVRLDFNEVTEESLLAQVVAEQKTVLEVTRGQSLCTALAKSCVVDPLEVSAFEAASGTSTPVTPLAAYDVVVLSDVLAYVREPVRLLRQCRDLLSPGGFLVVLASNFGYGALRLALFSGAYDDFAREQEANPRLHFFTLEMLSNVLRRAGFRLSDTLRRALPWDGAMGGAPADEALVQRIRRDREHETLTFVIKSMPVVQAVPRARQQRDGAAALKLELEAARVELASASALNGDLREAGRALRKQLGAVRYKARIADRLQTQLDSALGELTGAFDVRDDLLVRVHEADAAMKRLSAEHARLLHSLQQSRLDLETALDEFKAKNALLAQQNVQLTELSTQVSERNTQLTERNTQLTERNTQLTEQNARVCERAERAERTATDLAQELLRSTKLEIQHLSGLVDAAQQSRFWRVKRLLARLRGLLLLG